MSGSPLWSAARSISFSPYLLVRWLGMDRCCRRCPRSVSDRSATCSTASRGSTSTVQAVRVRVVYSQMAPSSSSAWSPK
ncbi:hypothetical protein SHIRM173S_02993 [Streptomyces hirsutus]